MLKKKTDEKHLLRQNPKFEMRHTVYTRLSVKKRVNYVDIIRCVITEEVCDTGENFFSAQDANDNICDMVGNSMENFTDTQKYHKDNNECL